MSRPRPPQCLIDRAREMRSRGVSYTVIGRICRKSFEWARLWTNDDLRTRRHAYDKARYAAKKVERQ